MGLVIRPADGEDVEYVASLQSNVIPVNEMSITPQKALQ